MCYSDVVPLWSDERLDIGAVPYRDTSVEYPVLTGGFMWLTAELTRGLHALEHDWTEVVLFGVLTSLLLALCGLVVTAATAMTGRGRPYDAALFALSPLLVFHAFSNWDLLAMALASAALWAWSQRSPGRGGGVHRARVRRPSCIRSSCSSRCSCSRSAPAATRRRCGRLPRRRPSWLTVNLPIAMAYHDGWWAFYKFSADRARRAQLGVGGRSRPWPTADPIRATRSYWVPPGAAVALAVVAGVLVVVWIGLSAPRKPRLAQLAFLAVLAFLLTTKVWSPQYSLWLVPLLALARPRWRLALVWQFVEIAVWFVTLTLLLGLDPDAVGPRHRVRLADAADRHPGRAAAGLAALIVRDIWRPERDVVRAGGVDDPGGGLFDGARDYFGRDSGARDGHNTGEPDTSSSGLRASNLS